MENSILNKQLNKGNLFTVFTCLLFPAILAAERAPALLSIVMVLQLLSVIAFTTPKKLWVNFAGNRPFFIFSFCYLFLLLGFFYSSNLNYLLERLQIKLPLLLYALIIPSIGELSCRQKKNIFYSLIASLVLAAMGILVNYALHFDAINQLYLESKIMPGPINHIRFSLLVVFGIYFIYNRLFSSNFSTHEKQLILVSGIFLVVFLHIYSVRSGLLCLYLMLGATLVNYVIRTRNYKVFIISCVVMALIGFSSILLSPTFKNKVLNTRADVNVYSSKQDPNYNSLSTRMVSYEIALDIFREHPLLGCGQGDLRDRNEQLFREKYPSVIVPIIPHNQFLYYLAATGLLGVLTFLISFTALLWWQKNYRVEFILITYLILLVAFQFEAMLETQLGVACTVIMLLLAWVFSRARSGHPHQGLTVTA